MAGAAERNATREIIRLAASQGRTMRGRPQGHYASLVPKMLSVPRDPLLPMRYRKKGRKPDERLNFWRWPLKRDDDEDAETHNVGPGRQIIRNSAEDLPEP
jgi:hypothetical protein